MMDFQFAYKSKCGCHTLIQNYITITNRRKSGIAIFFDIKRAFSSVNRKHMFADVFKKLGRDAFLFKYKNLLQVLNMDIQLGFCTISGVPYRRGTPEGSCISGFLWAIIMATVGS